MLLCSRVVRSTQVKRTAHAVERHMGFNECAGGPHSEQRVRLMPGHDSAGMRIRLRAVHSTAQGVFAVSLGRCVCEARHHIYSTQHTRRCLLHSTSRCDRFMDHSFLGLLRLAPAAADELFCCAPAKPHRIAAKSTSSFSSSGFGCFASAFAPTTHVLQYAVWGCAGLRQPSVLQRLPCGLQWAEPPSALLEQPSC